MFRNSIEMNSKQTDMDKKLKKDLIRPLKWKYLKHSLKIKHSLVGIRKSDSFAED